MEHSSVHFALPSIFFTSNLTLYKFEDNTCLAELFITCKLDQWSKSQISRVAEILTHNTTLQHLQLTTFSLTIGPFMACTTFSTVSTNSTAFFTEKILPALKHNTTVKSIVIVCWSKLDLVRCAKDKGFKALSCDRRVHYTLQSQL